MNNEGEPNREAFDVPVGLVIFNRPEHTARVLAEIARVRPRKLMVAADGPRPTHPNDAVLCQAARAVVEQTVDWDCDLRTLYSDVNLGLAVRVATACDWFFSQEEEVIVLEDDCVPNPSFFPFCAELLERYRNDPRVMVISGDNCQFGRNRTPYSYFFSRYPHIWGWASWRRTWNLYDPKISQWPELRRTDWLARMLNDSRAERYWRRILDGTYMGRMNTWDYQLLFAIWMAGGLCVIPENNLVSNIGFGAGATHTTESGSPLANMPVHPVELPLRHPPEVLRHVAADEYDDRTQFTNPTLLKRVRQKLRRVFAWRPT